VINYLICSVKSILDVGLGQPARGIVGLSLINSRLPRGSGDAHHFARGIATGGMAYLGDYMTPHINHAPDGFVATRRAAGLHLLQDQATETSIPGGLPFIANTTTASDAIAELENDLASIWVLFCAFLVFFMQARMRSCTLRPVCFKVTGMKCPSTN
jgi:hypothetical protein